MSASSGHGETPHVEDVAKKHLRAMPQKQKDRILALYDGQTKMMNDLVYSDDNRQHTAAFNEEFGTAFNDGVFWWMMKLLVDANP